MLSLIFEVTENKCFPTPGDHENFNQIARRYCTERIPCNKSLYNNELLRQSGLKINASIGTINVIFI